MLIVSSVAFELSMDALTGKIRDVLTEIIDVGVSSLQLVDVFAGLMTAFDFILVEECRC